MFVFVKEYLNFSRREVFTIRALKERLLYSLIGTVLCAVATIFFICTSAWHAAILFAAGTVVLLVCTFRSSEQYQVAKLITENPILNIGVASVAAEGAGETAGSSVNVVVSGFGILMNGRPYRFGYGGVELRTITIDRESISLSFGGEEKAYSVRLLHGIADKTDIDRLTERLLYETGVAASVSGW